jgi:hypothetical protein
VEWQSAPGESTDVGGEKARCRARLELTARKTKVQVRTHSSASHISAFTHTLSSSISGDSKRLHGRKVMSGERERSGVRMGSERRREGATEQRGGRNENGPDPHNCRARIEEGRD